MEPERKRRPGKERGDGPSPQPPHTLPELAEATLEALRQEPGAASIILGGGIALKHYLDYRTTQDLDAWWKGFRNEAVLAGVRTALERVAQSRGYLLEHRQFGATDSLEFKKLDGNLVPGSSDATGTRTSGEGKKVFSFQIAMRERSLDEPLVSAWPPLLIETFRDNIGSKMNALVNRGAPRDLLDIYRVVEAGLITPDECWHLWQEKNPSQEQEEARGKVRTHLARLEQRRPLDTIPFPEERARAAALRHWYPETFLVEYRTETPAEGDAP